MKVVSALFFITALLISATGIAQTEGMPKAFLSEMISGDGLLAEYYNGTNFNQKVLTRHDDQIDFNFYLQSPAPGVNSENYSIRWTGNIYAPVSGEYTIRVRVDDGIRLWFQGFKILDKWKLQEATAYSTKVRLQAGEYYSIKIEYYNGPYHGVMQLLWEMPVVETKTFLSFFTYTPDPIAEPIPHKYLYTRVPVKEPTPLLSALMHAPVLFKASEHPVKEVANKNRVDMVAVEKSENKVDKLRARAESRGSRMHVNMKASSERNEDRLFESLAEEDIYENLKPGDQVQFNHVLFEQGKPLLLEGSAAELDKLARTMKYYPNMKIRIEGHTDNVGNPRVNLSLSYFRAKVVANYLIEQGIDPARLEAHGNGSSKPLDDNATEAGRAKNRRVQFIVM